MTFYLTVIDKLLSDRYTDIYVQEVSYTIYYNIYKKIHLRLLKYCARFAHIYVSS